MSMEQFSSTLAPAMRELIQMKRNAGTKYIHGEILLGQFDRFCVETEYSDTVLSEELIIQWKKYNENRKHRQKSQMLTYVRHLGQYLKSNGKDTYIPPMEYRSGTSDPIELSSVFGPDISDFITLKRANGYCYDTEERLLYRFDRHYSETGITEPLLMRDMIYDWAMKTTYESLSYFRQFAKYLLSVGMEVYVPRDTPSQFHRNPYILSDSELSAFFEQVDGFQPNYCSCDRMAAGYNMNHMMPYLSRYLGHKTIEETHYYYHLSAAATDIIRACDLTSENH